MTRNRTDKYQLLPFSHCALCTKSTEIKLSHIIPKYFGRALKHSESQTIIDGLKPNRIPKPQDIAKAYMLCGDCEERICKFETSFRKQVMPANKSLLAPIPYSGWMLKFAVSVSWRILTYLKYATPHLPSNVTHKGLELFIPPLSSTLHTNADKALEIWRAFLMEERTDVDIYKQHILILNGKNFPYEYCNAVGFTIFQQGGIAATQAMMTQFIILGFIEDAQNWKWEGTMIDTASGFLGKKQKVPKIYFDWLAKMYVEIYDSSMTEWKERKKGKGCR